MDKKNMMKIVGGVKRSNGKTKWMPLGMAFLNKDGTSWSLKLDTVPGTQRRPSRCSPSTNPRKTTPSSEHFPAKGTV